MPSMNMLAILKISSSRFSFLFSLSDFSDVVGVVVGVVGAGVVVDFWDAQELELGSNPWDIKAEH